MAIWFKQPTKEDAGQLEKGTLMETLDIRISEVGDDYICGTMPVDHRTVQPYGILHGGATAALAETVGSCASALFIDTKTKIVKGIELSINHLKSKKQGVVFGVARPIHKGRTTHLWEIKIVDEDDNLISICKLTNIVLDKK